jgi:plastocyanin
MRVTQFLIRISGLLLASACGGGGSDGGGTNPPPPATVSSVSLSKGTALLKPTETTIITATPRDASGNALSGKTVQWSVASSTIASISPNGSSVTVTGVADGQTDVTATVEGVSKQARITVTSSFATSADVTVGAGGGNVFDPSQVDIASGGTVSFTWGSAVTHNVTFQSPPAPVANITDRSSGGGQVTFNTPGTYNYQCTIHGGMNGTVTVH